MIRFKGGENRGQLESRDSENKVPLPIVIATEGNGIEELLDEGRYWTKGISFFFLINGRLTVCFHNESDPAQKI